VPVAGTTLVSYTGAQPRGYVLDKVPAGWKVDESDAGVLTLAPRDPAGYDNLDREATDPLQGKIGVWLQARVPNRALLFQEVQNGKRTTVFVTPEGDDNGDNGARSLYLSQPSGHYLVIHVWAGLGWSNSAIVELASAIHVTKYATVSAGRPRLR
jgi:hypothetical protein